MSFATPPRSCRPLDEDEDDARYALAAAEAARAALREYATRAAAEREAAEKARDASFAEAERLRADVLTLRVALAETRAALAARDDEVAALTFKTEQLMRRADEASARAAGARSHRARVGILHDGDDASIQAEERAYVEALATALAAAELDAKETRRALALERAARQSTERALADAAERHAADAASAAADADDRLAAAAAAAAARETALEDETANIRARLDVAEARVRTLAEAREARNARDAGISSTRTSDRREKSPRGEAPVDGRRESTSGVPVPVPDANPSRAAIEALAEHQRAMWAQLEALRVERERVGGLGLGVEAAGGSEGAGVVDGDVDDHHRGGEWVGAMDGDRRGSMDLARRLGYEGSAVPTPPGAVSTA